MSIKLILIAFALALLILTQATNSLADPPAASQSGRNRPIPAGTNVERVDVFYSYLTPYGRWFTLGQYGLVWSPTVVGPDWNPYADGEWVFEDSRWTWESDDPWGWATCHYGRWFKDATYGWVWVPGTIWSPAWVNWLRGGGYVGWAPQPPDSVLATEADVPISCYTFVQEPYFDNDDNDAPNQHKRKHPHPKGGQQYIHLPASARPDLRRWEPAIPVWANRPGTTGASGSAVRPEKNSNPVQQPSNATRGQFSGAQPKPQRNGAPAIQATPGNNTVIERPAQPVAPHQDNPVEDRKNGGVKAEPVQPERTYRQQPEEPRRLPEAQPQQNEKPTHRQVEAAPGQQGVQQQQAEQPQRQQAEEARRQQEAQQKQAEEAARQQDSQRQQAEESRRQQEAQQKQAEEAQRKQAEEARRQQEAQRQQAEESRRQQE